MENVHQRDPNPDRQSLKQAR